MAAFPPAPEDPWTAALKARKAGGPRPVSTTLEAAPLPGGGMTLDALMQRQKERARQTVPMTDMHSPWQGAAYAANSLLQGFKEGRAEADVAAAQGLVGGALDEFYRTGELGPEASRNLSQYDPDLLVKIYGETHGEQWQTIPSPEGAQPGSVYQQNSKTGEIREVGGSSGMTINTGDTTGTLDKEFSKQEAEQWRKFIDSGGLASEVIAGMDMIDQLSATAPQGGLTGRLAEMFPNFTSAGAAFQSVISGLAPKLKVEGSGAQSDRDLDNIIKSLPRLSNSAAANRLISEFVRKKAEQNRARAMIVQEWAGGPRDLASTNAARLKMQELNSQTLMTPDLQTLTEAVAAESGAPAPAPTGTTEPGTGGGSATEPPKKNPILEEFGL